MIWASRVTRRKSSILPGRDVHFKKKKNTKTKNKQTKILIHCQETKNSEKEF